MNVPLLIAAYKCLGFSCASLDSHSYVSKRKILVQAPKLTPREPCACPVACAVTALPLDGSDYGRFR